MEQRFTFDQIAGAYRTSRPDYPEALVDDVVAYAALCRGDPILEIGCGTGQATKSFAKRDLQIVAIDPGPEMIRTARESLVGFGNVELAEATFEAWPNDRGPFRLIIAAQSWHWVSPELRFVKAAKLLSSEGVLAIFGHVPTGLPGPLLEQFKDISLRHTGRWGPPPEAWYLPSGPFKGWFDESGLFGPVEHRHYPWTWRHTTSSYAKFLGTRSDIRMLTQSVRDALVDDLSAAIDRHGGGFDMDYETHLYMARRAPN
ncbi:class I SAM-dependent methyltransferase [Bradyrhizobium sp. INPA01-394B]|uniref:Methyltransferase domain-containing protein n=1 Tax=Bradyrhizobium campsiandrae TaxID=1729892 RepID=A0ABR7UGH7_9BRAD|nr:class I SAM-dependent methyltransferase [Bradyrhizobium campsiandrae]MBC9879073.1 class I SAM-dependent methyltransferase [Bradyrhizobium campsiandrae]MBC9982987.1 methyltransferase domain-containing protein [Bradyrhizobium campsiandrae]